MTQKWRSRHYWISWNVCYKLTQLQHRNWSIWKTLLIKGLLFTQINMVMLSTEISIWNLTFPKKIRSKFKPIWSIISILWFHTKKEINLVLQLFQSPGHQPNKEEFLWFLKNRKLEILGQIPKNECLSDPKNQLFQIWINKWQVQPPKHHQL